MLQPYGVDVAGDMQGGMVIVAVWFALGGARGSLAARLWLLASFALSAAGSVQVSVLALERGELSVMLYHLFWVAVSVGLCLWQLSALASRLRRSARRYRTGLAGRVDAPGPYQR